VEAPAELEGGQELSDRSDGALAEVGYQGERLANCFHDGPKLGHGNAHAHLWR
jgi:hypothetical protein